MFRYNLVIDDREKAVIPFFSKQAIKSKVGRITTGDYVFLMQDVEKKNKAKPVIVFERKSWKDFSESFKDGRFDNNENLREFREKYGSKIIFILEGQAFPKPKRKFRGIPFKNIAKRVDHMMLVDGFHMVQTPDPEGTATRISDICLAYMQYEKQLISNHKQLNADLDKNAKLGSKEDTPIKEPVVKKTQENVIELDKETDEKNLEESDSDSSVELEESDSDSKKENSTDSMDIPTDLKKVRQKTNDQVLLDMWRALPQVSSTTAAILSEHFTIRDVLCGKIMVPQISQLTYPSGTKIGEARAKKILEVGISPQNKNSATKVATLAQTITWKTQQEKILKSIKGVSADTAKAILKKYTLKELCETVSEKELAELKKTEAANSRKVGPAIAKKIMGLLKAKNV